MARVLLHLAVEVSVGSARGKDQPHTHGAWHAGHRAGPAHARRAGPRRVRGHRGAARGLRPQIKDDGWWRFCSGAGQPAVGAGDRADRARDRALDTSSSCATSRWAWPPRAMSRASTTYRSCSTWPRTHCRPCAPGKNTRRTGCCARSCTTGACPIESRPRPYRRMDGIFVVCDEQRERIVRQFSYPENKISLVGNTPGP